MVAHPRWQHRIEEIIRSRHYTWIAEGLGGDEVSVALQQILSDAMHVAHHAGLDWDNIYQAAQQQFEQEELEAVAHSVRVEADITPVD
ncbi:hypothetical protein GC176_13045 [bacterium]|nr:hypothetical protein [bacterium]